MAISKSNCLLCPTNVIGNIDQNAFQRYALKLIRKSCNDELSARVKNMHWKKPNWK